MTLRGRLTAALLAVVLGPLVLAAGAVGVTATRVLDDRGDERLRAGDAVLSTAVEALCQRARAAAETLATATVGGASPRAATASLVQRRLADGAVVESVDGRITGAAGAPAGRVLSARRADPRGDVAPIDAAAGWSECAGTTAAATGPAPAGVAPTVVASVELRRPDGTVAGRVRAAFTVTAVDLADLARAAGVGATALTPSTEGPAGTSAALVPSTNESAVPSADARVPSADDSSGPSADGGPSTEGSAAASSATSTVRSADRAGMSTLPDAAAATVAAAARSGRDRVTVEGEVLRLRVLPAAAGRPLRFVLTTPAGDPTGLYGALAAIVVAAGVGALISAGLLARALTRPLQEVAAAAQLVADGDLGARVPVRAFDEVGRLAATFNRMTRGMEAYVAALTAGRDQLRGTLALLGDTLSSTNDVTRVLAVILESAVTTTAAEAGIVLLADGDPLVLTGRSGKGMAGRGVAADAVQVPVGEGLVGVVAAEREARTGRIGTSRPALTLSPREPHCRTYIAVPLLRPSRGAEAARLLGVLALYDRLGGDDFDDADLVTVRSFAGHAAVAVENALLHRAAAAHDGPGVPA